MAAKVISLVQQKGGAGRSTLSCNLAGILSKAHPTALIDCDSPQGTATGWHYIRERENLADGLTLATAEDHRGLIEEERRLKAAHDFIIIDSPPRNAAMTRAAVILADLNIIPLAPTALEIWSTNDVVEVIEEAAKVRKDIDARLCWNRYRAVTKSAQELSKAVKKELPLPVMRSRLSMRVSFSDSIEQGRTIMEWHDQAAKHEMVSLINEVTGILRRK